MDEPGEDYVKWNKPDKDKYCTVSFICGIKKKCQSYRNRVEWWLPGAGRWGKWVDTSQRI